jgi:hypothetical protein
MMNSLALTVILAAPTILAVGMALLLDFAASEKERPPV